MCCSPESAGAGPCASRIRDAELLPAAAYRAARTCRCPRPAPPPAPASRLAARAMRALTRPHQASHRPEHAMSHLDLHTFVSTLSCYREIQQARMSATLFHPIKPDEPESLHFITGTCTGRPHTRPVVMLVAPLATTKPMALKGNADVSSTGTAAPSPTRPRSRASTRSSAPGAQRLG